jgi:glycosyltransferase involved in cell wall biosynthesis
VDLVYSRFGADQPSAEFDIPNLELHEVEPSRGVRRLASYTEAFLRGAPDAYARGVSPEVIDAARRYTEDTRAARVIADGPTMAAALIGLAKTRPLIYNAHNVESNLHASLVNRSPRSLSTSRLRRFEAHVFDRYQETWVVSGFDEEWARRLAPKARFRYVPNVVDVKAIEPAEQTGSGRVLFAGNFAHPPNKRALRMLIDDVMPRLWQDVPDAHLILTGPNLATTADDERIHTLGFVDNLASVYRSVDCVVVPLREGGGSPLKFVEALAYGLPVVATSIAARGLDVVPGTHFLQADEPAEIARKLAHALTDTCSELRRAARALAVERYSIEALTRIVAA